MLVILVPKKDKTKRMCIDIQAIKNITVKARIEKKMESYARQAHKGRKKVVFKLGG